MSARRSLSFVIKLSVSIFFLVYLLRIVQWEDVWKQIVDADVFYLVVYLSLGFAGVLISSVKWLVLARPHGVSAPLRLLFLLYTVGYFFNNFLPTSVGGDVVRAYELGRAYGKQPEAMASVFMERFTGYVTLVVFALAAIAFDRNLQRDIRLAAPVIAATLGIAVLGWAVLRPSWLQFFQKRFPSRIVQKPVEKIYRLQGAIYGYIHHPAAVLLAVAYSIAFYLLSVVTVYTGCLTFHAEVPFTSLLTAVPVILILFMIPISLGGIGVQEWAYYFVLEIVGVPASVGLSLGLLYRARSLAFGVLGGAIYPFLSSGSRALRDCVPSESGTPPEARAV